MSVVMVSDKQVHLGTYVGIIEDVVDATNENWKVSSKVHCDDKETVNAAMQQLEDSFRTGSAQVTNTVALQVVASAKSEKLEVPRSFSQTQ